MVIAHLSKKDGWMWMDVVGWMDGCEDLISGTV
jgi:hypothetical protein